MNKFEKYYLKLVVKSKIMFYFLLLFMAIFFIVMAVTIKIDIVQTFDGTFANDRIVFNDIPEYQFNDFYIYKSRGEKMVKLSGKHTEVFDQQFLILYLDGYDYDNTLEGPIKVDIVKKQSNLLKIMFKIENKYILEDYNEGYRYQ